MPLPRYVKSPVDLDHLDKRNEAYREVFLKYQAYIQLCEEHSKLPLQEQLKQKSEIAVCKEEWMNALQKFREEFPLNMNSYSDSDRGQ